jgi:phosphopantothenoylcysteine decarboxylase/phosphopantothenate--cysteine ligase
MKAAAGRRILIGVTGGIAAYKVPELVRLLQMRGFEVRCVLTESAQQFVSPLVLETLSGHRVASRLCGPDVSGTEHIEIARWPDLVLVAPATANTLARAAHGLADDLLSTVLLATRAPVIAAPAMNTAMWEHPSTRENCRLLEQRGMTLIEPAAGVLACGEEGAGKLPDLEVLASACERTLLQTDRRLHASLQGTSWLITAGPTKTFIDPVRYITNPSTGWMGKELAEEGLARGAEIRYVLGIDKGVVAPMPSSRDEAARLKIEKVHTAAQMLDASLRFLPDVSGVIATAAVMDYEVAATSTTKLKRAAGASQLALTASPDVLAGLRSHPQAEGKRFVGFAAETCDLLENGKKKLESKRLDHLFANPISLRPMEADASTGFGSPTNSGIWLSRGAQPEHWELGSKREIARRIWDRLEAACS